MKKILPILLIVLVVIGATIFLSYVKKNPTVPITPIVTPSSNVSGDEKAVLITDEERINKIKNESYLNILLSINVFDELNKDNLSLLVAAMRIAGEQDLVKTTDDKVFLEYVPRNVIHDIIYELTGTQILEPIGVDEDFYYKYDEEGDYYYVVPTNSDWLSLLNINSISYTDKTTQYVINCSASTNNVEDAENSIYPNVIVKLQYKPNNKYVKYQLTSINIGTAQ